ncbi:MAG: hypothetical protein ACTSWN_15710, partial [Promethearchaeota archaeon]
EITPFDGVDTGTPRASAPVEIQNAIPSLVSAGIMPVLPNTTSTLTAVASGWSDADGDPEGYTYRWFKNGALIVGAVTSVLNTSNFVKNDVIIVEITPFDGYSFGSPVNSSSIQIQNLLPSITAVLLVPDPAYTNDDITAVPQNWTDGDGDPENYSYRWFVNGIETGNIGGTLPSTYFIKGDVVICEVTPNDGQDFGVPVNSSTLSINNSAPSPPAYITPNVTTDKTPYIQWFGALDLDNDTLIYRIRIVNVNNTSDVITDWTYVPTNSFNVTVPMTLGEKYNVSIIANDSESESVLFWAYLNTTNTPPAFNMSIDNISPNSTYALLPVITWNPAFDPDENETITYWIRIRRSSSNSSPPILDWTYTDTNTSIDLSIPALGLSPLNQENYTVELIANDGKNDSLIYTEILEILNTPPTIANVTLFSNDTVIRENSTIQAIPSGWSDINPNDNDQIMWYWEWRVNGSITVLNGTVDETDPITINGTYFDKNDYISCVVWALDHFYDRSLVPAVSESWLVHNTPPVVFGVEINLQGEEFLLNETYYPEVTGYYDADNDNVEFQFLWYIKEEYA